MKLDEILVREFENLGSIRFSNSFGWICVYIGKNLFAGYKVIDDNIIILWLILSTDSFKESLVNGFEKFDFGKTWAETEIGDEEDINRIIPFITNAFSFTKERKTKSK